MGHVKYVMGQVVALVQLMGQTVVELMNAIVELVTVNPVLTLHVV